MSDVWPWLRRAAPAFARTLGPLDLAKVVTFSGPAYMIQDFTRDPEAIATSLAMAPAMLLAQRARVVDLDGPLLLARDRPNGLRYEDSRVHPAVPALWG